MESSGCSDLLDRVGGRFIESAPVGIFFADHRGTILYGNPALARLAGVEETVSGHSVLELFGEKTAGRFLREIVPAVIQEGRWAGDLTILSGEDREVLTMSHFFAPPGGLGGSPIIAGVVSDHTCQREDHADPFAQPEGWRSLLEAVILQSPIPMVLVSHPDMVIRIYNKACQEILGVEDEPSKIGQSLFEFEKTWQDFTLDGREIPFAELPLLHALEGKRTHQADLMVVRKDGTVRYELVEGVPIFNKDGRLIAGFIAFPDITRQKRSENLLRAQYDLALRLSRATDLDTVFRVGIESLLRIDDIDAGWIHLVDERTGDASLAVSEGISSRLAESTGRLFLGSPPARLALEGSPVHLSRDELERWLGDDIRSEGLRAATLIPIRPSDMMTALIFVASRCRDEMDSSVREALEALASQLVGAVSHVKAIELVHRNEERYRNFIANAGEGIYRIDFKEPIPIDLPKEELEKRVNAEAIIGEINVMAARMYGQKPDEMIGRPVIDFAPDTGKRVLQLLESPGYRISDVETMDFDKDGRSLHFSENGTAIIDGDGRLIRIWGTQRDITARKKAEQERKRLEEQLRQSQKMEAVGRLAGGIAHDFNNIMTGINGYAEMILESLGSNDPLRSDVEEIRRAGERAASLTSQLLAFSRKQVIAPLVVDPNEVLDRSQSMLRRIIGEDIDLDFRPGSYLGRIRVDPSQLEQLLVNLAVNARDAMPDGGKLTIETTNMRLDETYCKAYKGSRPGDFVMLSVSDNGCGMDKETMSRIFEPFFTTKKMDKGTGLGLSMVYGVVQQNNGFINVYSEPGMGTSFKIYFPRIFDEPTRIEDSYISRPAGGTETILLVEDEELVRTLARRVLERQGYRVIETSDVGAAYLSATRYEGKIHLLLTDVVMPMMNGRELFEKLSELRPDMKVLYMSGYTENVIAHHGVLEPGTQFIQKPFSIQSLSRRVREVLDSK